MFDTIIDSATFHVFDDPDRARYVASLAGVVPAGGRYHLLCFSELVPGTEGPRRVRREEIEAAFAVGWRIDSIEPARLETNFDPGFVPAWRGALTRV